MPTKWLSLRDALSISPRRSLRKNSLLTAWLPVLLLPVLTLPVTHATAQTAGYPVGFGPEPHLPAPADKLVPTVHVAKANPWGESEGPTAATGLKVEAYARGLDHPRWLYVLPNGDVLVAESNAPEKHDAGMGIKGAVMGHFKKKAGAGTPSPDRIVLLRGIGENGAAKLRTVFLEGLHSPFGMALIGNDLYIADTDAILRFPYQTDMTAMKEKGTRVLDLPAGEINHHWTKNIIASRDGSKLYISVGSNSNAAENGIEAEAGRAAIHELDLASGKSRLFATGLRNPNGMAWQPQSGALWTVVNERDELGNDLVPDYLTSVRDGAFYGWPYSYFGAHVDERVEPRNPALVGRAIAPDYALGAHTASLGLTFYSPASSSETKNALPEKYANGAFIGQHGSWNRKPYSGYKVIFVPFKDGRPAGPPEDVLTGFLANDETRGRPVGVVVDSSGALLVADDVGNAVWRISRP